MPGSDHRSLLFVPAGDGRKFHKALGSGADAIILDLEDAVLPDAKEAARSTCIELARGHPTRPAVWLRINEVGSGWFLPDMEVCRQIRPDGIVLPKSESAADLEAVTAAGRPLDFPICALIETPLGLLHAEEIARARERVAALAFGAEDFCSALGIQRSSGQTELLHARSSIVIAAKAYGLAAIDSPCFALDDLESVRRDALQARQLGFTGMLAIHPKQIPVLAEVFSPGIAEVREAQELLDHAANSAGAFAWKGKMADEATLKRARAVLREARHEHKQS